MSDQPVPTLSPKSPESELKRLRARIAEKEAFIEQQNERIHELEERIQVLETRLAQDSHNSSRPPSSRGQPT